jgi:hypothetical protein
MANNGNGSGSSGRKPAFDAFTVLERGEGKKNYWLKVGAAWENQDGSYSVNLDALPLGGRIQLRKPFEESADETPARKARR